MAKRPVAIQLMFCVVFLTACASAPAPYGFDRDAFLQGESTLTCTSLDCATSWRFERGNLRTLYDSQDWETLATRVSSLNYDSDLAYFYLGRAAQELGGNAAAVDYFGRAQTASKSCEGGLFNGCGDIDVMAESQARIVSITAMQKKDPTMSLVEAQTRLKSLGLYTAEVDGITGPRTLAAIRAFQTQVGIEASGVLTGDTIETLQERSVDPGEALVAENVSKATTITAQTPAANAVMEPASIPAVADSEAPVDLVSEQVQSDSTADAGGLTALEEVPETPESAQQDAPKKPESVTVNGERSRVKVEVELLADADPFAPVVSVIRQGAWVTILDRGQEWSKVSHDDKTGYLYSDNLQ